ncbi:hypothetical protein [Pseudonocardia sp. Ae717_Ps2]|uniref:hypothetical protein n=1 Tax=Pseudonocardia sp. Ae717_Ps2 TaxID=1885573 RepID=UPI001179ECF2|nr:hypothetical protein [Pseudonocardia sp. Ae717_Ps2]
MNAAPTFAMPVEKASITVESSGTPASMTIVGESECEEGVPALRPGLPRVDALDGDLQGRDQGEAGDEGGGADPDQGPGGGADGAHRPVDQGPEDASHDSAEAEAGDEEQEHGELRGVLVEPQPGPHDEESPAMVSSDPVMIVPFVVAGQRPSQ